MAWTSEDDAVVIITMKRSSNEVWIEPGLTDEQLQSLETTIPQRLAQLRTTWHESVVEP